MYEKSVKVLILTREIGSFAHKFCDHIGECTRGEYMVMNYLFKAKNEEREVNPRDISKSLNMARPLLSRYIKNLEEKEFIHRKLNKEDKRYYFIEITNKGYDFVAENRKIGMTKLEKLLEHIGEDDTEKLIEILSKIVDYSRAEERDDKK